MPWGSDNYYIDENGIVKKRSEDVRLPQMQNSEGAHVDHNNYFPDLREPVSPIHSVQSDGTESLDGSFFDEEPTVGKRFDDISDNFATDINDYSQNLDSQNSSQNNGFMQGISTVNPHHAYEQYGAASIPILTLTGLGLMAHNALKDRKRKRNEQNRPRLVRKQFQNPY